LCVFFASSLATGIQAGDVGMFGGGGGEEFRSNCRANDVIVGLNTRSGKALDQLGIICIGLNAEKTEWAGS
jgi:hypothetical protein